MSRVCGFRDTTTGYPCTQIIENEHDHCEAGHPSQPEVAEYAPTIAAPDTDRHLSAEIDDLFGSQYPEDRVLTEKSTGVEENEMYTPPWKLRTILLSLLGGAGLDMAVVAGGVHSPVLLPLLGLIGIASPFIVGYGRHKDRVAIEVEANFTAKREARRIEQVGVIASSLEQVATELEVISTTSGARSDEARGKLEALSIHALYEALTPESKIALFRLRGQTLMPSMVCEGWHRRPPIIPLSSSLGNFVIDLAQEGSTTLWHRAEDKPELIIAPIMAGNALFGVIIAESGKGKTFDNIDTDLVAGYAKLVGLGLSMGRMPFEELTSPVEIPETIDL
jgi:hypothetical protein